jgi:glycosidase
MRRPAPEWLKTAVFYEIYPQSFCDSDADGIGDLPGIISRLDYIASLGCTAVWLNPCFDSTFRDGGYDITDFYKIAPRYGTNADMTRLCREAARRNIRVVLDLVAGHTSMDHEWFRQSSSAKPNKYSNWYIWMPESPPRNVCGLSAIRGLSEREGNYLANYYFCQPALNYGFARPDPKEPWQLPIDHPDVQAVRAELRNIMAYWLDRGVSGFRVDMASSLVKNDPGYKANIAHWKEVRRWMDKNYPDAALLSEWSMPSRAIDAGFHVDFMIHLYYDRTPPYTCLFRRHLGEAGVAIGPSIFSREGKGEARDFIDDFVRDYHATRNKGYISLPTGNHDIARIRKTRDIGEMKVIYAFLLTLPGVPCIYYGDEIGMRHLDGLPSKEGGYSRTGARTPMQWDTSRNAGFSKAPQHKLYLPIDPAPDRPAVSTQEKDSDSLLNHVRQLLALRRSSPALQADGKFEPLTDGRKQSAFAYMRQTGRERFVIALNPAGSPATLSLDARKLGGIGDRIFGAEIIPRRSGRRITLELPPVSYSILKLH